jgi:hypothetical protein
MSYLTPLFVFLVVFFGMANPRSFVAARRIIAGVTLYLCASMIAELLAAQTAGEEGYTLAEAVKECYLRSAESSKGGGIIGGTLVYLGHLYLGMVSFSQVTCVWYFSLLDT